MSPLRSRPRGVALLEMLATITVLTVLLILCAGMLRMLFQLETNGRVALDLASDQSRLGATLRADLHRATTNPGPALTGDRLTLTIPGGEEVVYSIRSNDLLREVRQGEKLQHRETYRRPKRSSVRFEANTEADRPVIALVIQRDRTLTRTASAEPDVRIEAEVGRLARWTGGAR